MSAANETDTLTPTLSPELDQISAQLVAARADARPLTQFPGDLPETLAAAYAVQSASIARWPDAVAGWKVGMVAPDYRQLLAAERLSGPIFRRSVYRVAPGDDVAMPIYKGGFAAVEAEFVFELEKTIEPVVRSYTDADLIDCVAALRIGAEIASSPMADVNRLGPSCVVCDFGNNEGLLVGPPIADWAAIPPDSLTAIVSVDGAVVGTATAAAIEGGLLQALRFLVTLCANRKLELAAGTYVSCGALTGIHDVTVDSKATVDFGEFGAFDVSFEAMLPLRERHSAAPV
ncbi:MAG: 2-keto-4-pentenoate hydratase [Pseudomonadota bacterium]